MQMKYLVNTLIRTVAYQRSDHKNRDDDNPGPWQELELIYGIGPKIVTDYGKDILALVASHAGAIREGIAKNPFKTPSLPGNK